jgi:hypothetical protein
VIFRVWESVLDYVKGTPFWSRLQPLFAILSLYLTTIVLAYQYIQWQYGLTPSLALYLRSYLFRQVTVAFLAFGLVAVLLSALRRWEHTVLPEGAVRSSWRYFAPRVTIAAAVLAVTVPLLLYLAPTRVSHIRVKFLAEPRDVDPYAFVYLLYELNKRQRDWYFELDFDTFNADTLTSAERRACPDDRNQALCYAEVLAQGRPFIGITSTRLGEDFFWQNRGPVSAVSTFGWQDYAPPSTYDYLAYSVMVQSILIHLNTHCTGLPPAAFRDSRVAYGDLFQYTPRRSAMKAAILAAHLSPRGEELLLNCFGPAYVTRVASLLSLDWLHSGKVPANLRRVFRIEGLTTE